ncbi:MAG: hypothetical protein ACE5H3_09000 [Planctomycetota bacterium]
MNRPGPPTPRRARLRFARPSDPLEEIAAMCRAGLGLEELGMTAAGFQEVSSHNPCWAGRAAPSRIPTATG